jgi:hypothetical protein
MDLFNEIFQNLKFYFIKFTSGFALYASRISCSYGLERKYVLLLVPINLIPKRSQPFYRIYELGWASLQTRSLNDPTYDSLEDEQYLDSKLLDPRYDETKYNLILGSRNEHQTQYYSTLPVEVLLLHNPKKKSMYQYDDNIEIRKALNTFQCIIRKI